MGDYHEAAELAPRDVVSRAYLPDSQVGGGHVFLDLTHLDPGFVRRRFPRIHGTCLKHGIDIATARNRSRCCSLHNGRRQDRSRRKDEHTRSVRSGRDAARAYMEPTDSRATACWKDWFSVKEPRWLLLHIFRNSAPVGLQTLKPALGLPTMSAVHAWKT